ncbi:MAG: hypothetical protein NTW83_05765 [Cyanobacteria bacterium]|nr:hypothetical protein [Cyanobacteriota bacterium]
MRALHLTIHPGLSLLGAALLGASCLVVSTTPAWASPATLTPPLEGTQAPGSEKESPYAAPKETIASAPMVNTGKLWALLVPIVLATGSYLVLRSREDREEG